MIININKLLINIPLSSSEHGIKVLVLDEERSLLEGLSEGTDINLAFCTGGHSSCVTQLIITSSSSDEYEGLVLSFDRDLRNDLVRWYVLDDCDWMEESDVMSKS